jgi:hypothetical protein
VNSPPPPDQPRRRHKLLVVIGATLVALAAVATAVVALAAGDPSDETTEPPPTTPAQDVVGELATGFVAGSGGLVSAAQGRCVAEQFAAAIGDEALAELGTGDTLLAQLPLEQLAALNDAAIACLPIETVGAIVSIDATTSTVAQPELPTEPGG